MAEPITPEDLPRWVPGRLTIDSGAGGWDGMRVRGYCYRASDVPVPPMQDYMIVVYKQGATPMNRRCTRDWQKERVAPGAISVLTNATPSHWRWSEAIEVTHLYLSPRKVAAVAADAFERDIASIDLQDVLRAEDPLLSSITSQLEEEARTGGIGGRIYAESLRLQASIHLLRHYAEVSLKAAAASGCLNAVQKRRIVDYVLSSIDQPITLETMAAQLDLSVFHFSRKFRATFDVAPHAWLLDQRVACAQSLLGRGEVSLKAIAAEAGFADQSHMTRVFRRLLGTTPAAYRMDCAQVRGGAAAPGAAQGPKTAQ